MRLLLLLSLFASFLPLSAQSIDYRSPLAGPLLVTGTFGELRSNHFHAGLDFRASTNTPVYCVADGFVSRVVISPGGYGQAVYVDHPDGHRSVYAHLETLRPELLDTVRARQFAEEKFRQTIRFDSTVFPLHAGDQIGGVGNRGHSFGSHLHFEMRDARTDAALNPLDFGFSVPDSRAPQIRNLRVYELDNHGLETVIQTFKIEESRGKYTAPDTIVVGTDRLGLALKAYDQQNAMPNWNGIYGGELYADTTLVFDFRFTHIPFEETEYLNALTDYEEWNKNTSWYHRFWALTQDAMILETAVGGKYDGSLRLLPNRPLPVRMNVRDQAGNVSELAFTVVYRPKTLEPLARSHQYFLPAGEASIIDNGEMRLELDSNALYRDLFFRYAVLPDASAGHLSPTHQLHDEFTPLHGHGRMSIRPRQSIPDSLRNRVFLGKCTPEGKWTGNGGEWAEDGRFRANVYSFGDYALFLDTIPPTVEINYFATDLRRAAGFSLLIKDNVSGGLRYRGAINGKWALLEYDVKNDKLTYNFKDGDPGPGQHRFAITVTDGRGNQTVWKRNFRR